MLELRSGTIFKIETFPEDRVSAYKIWVDFGPEIGVKKLSAQITDLYTKEELPGRQTLGEANFPVKQVGPFRSEFLLTGFSKEGVTVVLAVPERPVSNRARLG